MKLAVSNIAWTKEEEPTVAKKLKEMGVKYVEIAPTKQWDDPTLAPTEEVNAYREWWHDQGIEVVAFQSMLFNRPDLKLFQDDENRNATEEYLEKFIQLGGQMGISAMVFGSPKNRQRGELSYEEATPVAIQFFSRLADIAAQCGVEFCIEPNAPQYACDFVINARQGAELVRSVNRPGFGLHLDTACMALANDDFAESINQSRDILSHFHISSPMLGDVTEREDVAHKDAARALRDIDYQGYVSIEMRPDFERSNVDRVVEAVTFVKNTYGT